MIYTTVVDRAVGQPITETIWDAQLRDNINNLITGPACRAYHSAAQATVSGTPLAIALDQERYDTDGIHNPASNNSRLTCQTAGRYHIWGNFEFDTGTGGSYRQGYVRLNGTTIIGNELKGVPPASTTWPIHVSATYQLVVGDYVEMIAVQNAGSGINILASPNFSPEFGMFRV